MIETAIIDKINKSNWADWSLEDIVIDYMDIKVEICDDDSKLQLICKNYIAFNMIGHWDESVIDTITINTDGDLLSNALSEVKLNYGERPPLGGGIRNISDSWYQLNLKLIDNVTFSVVVNNIQIV